MKIHPIAEIFPPMSDEDFAALRADINTYGVREPAWTWNGQIIDGRHRVLACESLGIECPTREYEGPEADLVAFVLSLNLKRRHLDASQRSMVAGRIADLKTGQHSEQGVPIGTAAQMLNVGARSVKRARKVIEQGVPALQEAVEKGEVSVAAAAEVAELPKSQQKRIVAQGGVKDVASKMRENKPKPDASERLKAELEEANSTIKELAAQQQPLQDEVEFLRKIESEGDKLAAACAEVKRLQAVVRGQEERIRGLMNEKNEAVRAAKMWKAKYEKAARAQS